MNSSGHPSPIASEEMEEGCGAPGWRKEDKGGNRETHNLEEGVGRLPVVVVDGDPVNLKITRPVDLALAAAALGSSDRESASDG